MAYIPISVKELLRYDIGQSLISKFDGTTNVLYYYIGRATPGTATSVELWQIKRVTVATGNVDWCDGDSLFDNEWDNRDSLSYS